MAERLAAEKIGGGNAAGVNIIISVVVYIYYKGTGESL